MYDLLETSLADRHVYCSSRILRNSEDLLEFLNKGVADRGIALTMAEGKDEGNKLDRTSFSKGYTLYAFDVTPDLGEDEHFTDETWEREIGAKVS